MLQGVCTSLDRMEQMMGEMKATQESMVLMLAQLSGSEAHCKEKQIKVFGSPSQTSRGIFGRYETHFGFSRENQEAKMDFSHFGGEGPRNWLREARKYFQLHHIFG
ncbi:Hypothetical predicted protein [Olea europaea subsp. europaea]|uniref:Uncharacterized protein n=1 Tax=Olea europaea subsp. europaea TaxID=158383 RepID=A0A8S0UG57_OLEEU|nr:Hypothetical predicted protein [Olea europaea subsp. europaea]